MEHWIRVEGNVRIFVNDLNPRASKSILLLHGWPANYKMFEYQYGPLLKEGYRCIGMDMRGFGKSDKPLRGYDYNRLADDVRRVIEALRPRNLILAGHSTGGAVAIRYMARHRGFGVSKLALFAAAAPSLIQRPNFPHGITAEDVQHIINQTKTDRPNMLREFGKTFFNKPVTEAFADWFFLLGLEAASWSTIAVSEAWLVEELFADLGKIKVPTLILHGVQDKVCLFPLAIAQHEGIVNSKLVRFENAGHGLFYDEREKFNFELLQFLQR